MSNVYQKRSGLALTGITLMLTVATFMATITITITLNSELAALFDRLQYEFEVTPNTLQPRTEMETLLTSIEEVERIGPASIYFIQLEGEYENFFTRNNLVQVFGLTPDSSVASLTYTHGEGWSQDPRKVGIVVSISIATQMGLEVGDEVAFYVRGQRITRELIGIERNGFDAAYLLWDDLATLVGSVEGVPQPNEYTVLANAPGRFLPVPTVGMDETLLAFILQTTAINTEPGVVITASLATAEALAVGDQFTFSLQGEEITRRIDAVVENEVLESAAAQFLPGTAAIPPDLIIFGYGDLVNVTGVSLEGEPLPNAYYVTVNADNPDTEKVEEVIDVVSNQLLEAGITSRFVNRVAYAESLNRIVVTNTSIIGAATILIAAVGAIGLITTLSIAVLERQKEIGVMRSIGADSVTIASQFVAEGLIVAFVAWMISIPVSYYLAIWLFSIFQLEYVPFTYPVSVTIIGLMGVIAISVVASLGPSMAAARKTVSDILRYQ
ncbi:MAG: hypothetical protein OHK0046_22090 [Anaerolineae bacterium]